MAEGIFANTAFEGSITPEVAVQNPVQDDSGAVLFGSINKGLSQATDILASGKAAQAKKANGQALTSLQDEIVAIADLVDGSHMKLPEARMKIRAAVTSFTASYPELVEDANTLVGKLLGSSGIANVATTGNELTQAEEKMKQAAFAAGFPSVDAYQRSLTAQNRLKEVATELDTIKAEGGIVTETMKNKGFRVVQDVLAAQIPWVDQTINNAIARIDAGEDGPTVVAKLKLDIATATSQIQGLKSQTGTDMDLSYFLKGTEDRVKALEDLTSGALTKTAYENQLAIAKGRDALAVRMANPELAKLGVTSEMLGPILSQALVPMMTEFGLDLLVKTIREPPATVDDTGQPVTVKKSDVPDLVGDDKDIRDVMAAGVEAFKQMGMTPSPEAVKEGANIINNWVLSVKKHGSAEASPQEYNAFMNAMADPVVGQFVVKNGIPKEAADGAIDTVNKYYGDILLPLVKSAWDDANIGLKVTAGQSMAAFHAAVGDGETADTSQFVIAVWNGSAVEFRPAVGLEANAAVKAAATKLNSEVAPPLNTLVRAQSHLAGSTDYKSFFDTNIQERLFSAVGDPSKSTPAPVNNAGKKVSLEDFVLQQDITPAESDQIGTYLSHIRTAESAGNDNADNPESTAFGRYQFINSTWKWLSKAFPELDLTDKSDPAQQERAIRAFTAYNARQLAKAGLPATNTNLYASHFFGDVQAVEVLTSDGSELISDIVPPKVMKANDFLTGMTVAQFKKWAARHSGDA